MSRLLLALEKFLTLSEAMAAAAEDQEWDDFAQICVARNAHSDDLPTDLGTQLAPAEQARGLTIIERCQQLDAKTKTLVEDRQKSLRVLLRESSP